MYFLTDKREPPDQYRDYVKAGVAQDRLNCDYTTLRRLVASGLMRSIRTAGGERRYHVDSYLSRPEHQRPRTVEDVRMRGAGDTGHELMIYEGIQCLKDSRHHGVAVYRKSDAALLFICGVEGCHCSYTILERKKNMV